MNQMKKTLTLGQVVLFGLAYMTPIIVLGTFGVLAVTTEGAVSGAYLAALIAMLFTAHSYGRMASAYPVAGSAYAYVRHAIDDRLGFIAGWAILLDYLFLPMVIWLIGAAYLHSAFPAIPTPLWLLAFIAVTTTINILGLRLASAVNSVMMLVQILVLIAFVGLSMHYVLGDPSQPFWSLTPFLGADSAATMPVLMAGAAVACYSFLAFALVNLSVIFHYYLKERRRSGLDTLWFLICPLIGLGAILWLMASLDHLAIMLGGAWLLCGLAWLTWLTRGFSRPTPELNLES